VYNASNTAVVSAASVTITNGIALYVLAAGDLTAQDLGEGWRVEWTLVFTTPSETHVFRNDGALVRYRLYPPATEADLYRICSSLDPNGGSAIHGELSFESKLDEAWVQIQHMLIERNNRPNLVISPSALRSAQLYLALALIFGDFATRLDAAYETRAAEYRESFKAAWRSVRFVYDDGDAGDVATGEQRSPHPGGFWMGRRGNASNL